MSRLALLSSATTRRLQNWFTISSPASHYEKDDGYNDAS